MAIVTLPSLTALANNGETNNYPATHSSANSPSPMTSVMSYQYPPPPPNGPDMGLVSQSRYLQGYSIPQAQGAVKMEQQNNSNLYAKADSDMSLVMSGAPESDDDSKSSKLKHSVWPSIVEQPHRAPSQPPSNQSRGYPPSISGERRRTKLPYHRSACACHHCRKRKIRCEVEGDDPQAPCKSCIHLKRPCIKGPPDQEVQTKGPSRSSGSHKMTPGSSPPMQTGMPHDMHAGTHAQLVVPSVTDLASSAMRSPGAESYSSKGGKVSSNVPPGRSVDYGQAGFANWIGPEASPASTKTGEIHGSTWRTYPTDLSYSAHAPAPSAPWPGVGAGNDSTPRDMSWSSYPTPPPRSMSFGTAENMHAGQHYTTMSPDAHHGDRGAYERKASSMSGAAMYPPPNIPGIETVPGASLDQNVTFSTSTVPSTSYSSWQQPYSGGWYGDSAGQQTAPAHHPSVQHQSGEGIYYSQR